MDLRHHFGTVLQLSVILRSRQILNSVMMSFRNLVAVLSLLFVRANSFPQAPEENGFPGTGGFPGGGEPQGSTDCPAIWNDIVGDLEQSFSGCDNNARSAIRFAFHDAGQSVSSPIEQFIIV